MRTFFVTGGTGFLGGQLLEQLATTGEKIFVLARDPEKAARANALRRFSNIEWVKGDISEPSVIPSVEMRERVLTTVTDVIHLAALYDLESSTEALYLANVVGTHNLVHLANQITKLKNFHYASTMAVSGDYDGIFTEQMFREGQRFPNAYAATKFAAEACIHDWRTRARRYIYRFGIIVGHSGTGYIPKWDGPYYLMKSLNGLGSALPWLNRVGWVAIPFSERTRLYLVPVDVAADAVVTAATQASISGPEVSEPNFSEPTVYHIMGQSGGIPIRTVLRSILKSFGVEAHILPLPQGKWVGKIAQRLGVPDSTLFYMYSPCLFSTRNIEEDFPGVQFPKFEEYADVLLGFAKGRLGQNSGRTSEGGEVIQ